MAATTVTRKGGSGPVPPRTLSTRQKKLGPAPFASFEDLSDDNDPSPPDSSGNKITPMPEIKEDTAPSQEQEIGAEVGSLQFGGVTVIPSTAATIASSSSAPTSGPTSGLQTPSTPRIDISCASSSTPPSEESNSERELFQGGLGFAFHEEGADDLRSSTEELEFGGDDDLHDASKKKQQMKQETEDLLRRASHPANVFHRKASLSPTDETDLLTRKPSAHSLYLEGFLQRPCRHSSFGSADRQRPGAISSLSADGRRSASPHKMLLETSFCGSKPIPTPSMDLDSPPDTQTADVPTASSQPQRHRTPTATPRESSGMLSSDSSFENQKPQKLTALTTVQVHHHQDTSSEPQQIQAPTPSPGATSGSRAIPPISSPDSPKSSDHWRPITPQELKRLSPRPTSPRPFRKDLTDTEGTWTPPAARKNSKDASNSSPIELKMTRNSSSSSTSKQQLQSVSSPAPVRKNDTQQRVQDKSSSKSSPLPPSKTTTAKKLAKDNKDAFKSPLPKRKELPRSDAIDNSPRDTPPGTPIRKSMGKSDSSGSSTKDAAGGAKSNKCESGSTAGKQFDEITTEMKITEDPFVNVEDVPIEKKGFFRDGSGDEDDDEDLPYVPTTLPLEKSSVVPIIPIKERRKLGTLVTTTPTQRPRCVRPPNPASLNDYIAYSSTTPQNKSTKDSSGSKSEKMKINLPRDESLPESSSTPTGPKGREKKIATTNWADFAEMGLRSPREIRRRMRMEENGASTTDETSAYQSDSSQETFGPTNGGSDDETESLLKLPKVPFANDLDVKSGRSSVISQEEAPASPGSLSSSQLEIQDNEDGS